MIRIGLVGYYGHGNFGDELFYECFKRYFPLPKYRLEVVSKSDPRMRTAADQRLERFSEKYDAVIIGGGDLIIPGYDVKNQYFYDEFLEVPVFVYGVGVPRWTGCDNKAFANLKVFFRSPNVRKVVARDQESAEWINRHLKPNSKAICSPDLVFSLNDIMDRNTLKPALVRSVGIVVRGGQKRENCKILELVEKLLAMGKRIKVIILGVGRELDFDFVDVIKLGLDELQGVELIMRPTPLDLFYAISGVDCLYSEKFHGCIAGLMAGIPTIAMLETDKFANLYRNLGIEMYLAHHNSDKLLETIEAIPSFPQIAIQDIAVTARQSIASLKKMIDELSSASQQSVADTAMTARIPTE